jgi:hypothetical protein
VKLKRAKALGALIVAILAINAVFALSAIGAEPQPEPSATDPFPTEPAPETEVNHEPETPEEATGSPFGVIPLDSSCFANDVCVWTGNQYLGAREVFACDGDFHPSYTAFYSAKNRCGSRRSWLYEWTEYLEIHYTHCLNPGGEIEYPGYFNGVKIGPLGENC